MDKTVLKTYGNDKVSYKPSKTYYMDRDNMRIQRKTDGLDAVSQAIWLTLSTERFWYNIFSWDYGVELDALLGAQRSYVEGDMERRIREALLQDDRIEDIENFQMEFAGELAKVSLTAVTIFGNVDIERSVALGREL